MENVLAHLNTKVAPDRSWGALERVGRANHGSSLLDDVQSLPDHSHDRGAADELHKVREERARREVGVVAFGEFLRHIHQLHRHQLVAALLKAADNVPDQAALDSVRLAHLPGKEGGYSRNISNDVST